MIFSIFTKVLILFLLTLILLKMYRYILFAAILLSACKHSQDCPGFVGADVAWLSYPNGDTAKFTDAAGNKISFHMQTSSVDPSYTEECGRGEPAGYYCKPCKAGANISGISDTMRRNTKWLQIALTRGDERTPGNIELSVFDYTGKLSFDYKTHQPQNANLLPTLTLGGTAYQDVYYTEADTTTPSMILISKIYYNKQFGILGFYDRQTHSLFYRE